MTPEEVVRAEMASWASLDADAIMDWFTPDAVWENVPYGPAHGHDTVRAAVEGFLTGMTRCDIEILHQSANGNIVLNERVDHIDQNGTTIHARCVGVYEVEGDKIVEWRDYFDTGRGGAS